MKIAITGANGYIGHYVQYLFKKDKDIGLKLLTIDDDTSPYIKIDYSENSLIEEFNGVDVVIHLAAIRNVKSYQEMEKNISLSDRVAKCAGQACVHKIIYASSISVYSDESCLPWKEGECEEPATLYGISKLSAEHLFRIYAKKYGMTYTNLRFAHVIGDNMPGTYMIPTFFRNISVGAPLKVIGKSVAKRELVDAVDIARALYWATNDARSDNQVVNIGTGIGLTNLEIAKEMSANSNSEVIYDDGVEEGIFGSIMDVHKSEELGFKALRSPTEAIRRIIGDRSKSIEEILL